MDKVAETQTPLRIYALSEKAVTVEFGDVISEDLAIRVKAFDELLRQHPFTGLVTTVPAYTTLTVFYEPLQVIQNKNSNGKTGFEKISGHIESLIGQLSTKTNNESAIITIPVCYGGNFGPDIEDVAQLNDLSVAEVISLHSGATYLVHMIGFVPGFAYLGGMSAELETPRKATPHAAIAPGSVGIAGKQTGIYPLQTPGGWQIIGRTPLVLFDPHRATPSLLKAGDRVNFTNITRAEFENYQS